MTTRNTIIAAALATPLSLAAITLACGPYGGPDTQTEERQQKTVELVICLDTSGSMNGLINAARQKLWAIVNDLALAQPTPKLRVALLTFGNDGHNAENGWVHVQTEFTEDLDLVSERLFALSTNGGTEYVGRVLQRSGQLQWSPSLDVLKMIVLAGNESAEQDQESPFRDVCSTLISRGIMINSIYCGPAEDDLAPAWRDVAKLADGQFASIDQDQGTVVVVTPFDEKLADLSGKLNTTYIPLGAEGQRGWQNQVAQDTNAADLNVAAAAARCNTKASDLYACAWDLVDASKAADFKLEEVKTEDLPENMQTMSVEERAGYIDTMNTKRGDIQKQIAEVNTRRETWIKEEMVRNAVDETKSFDFAIRRAVREQATAKGFVFQE